MAKTKAKAAAKPPKKKPKGKAAEAAKPAAKPDYRSPDALARYDAETTGHLNALRAESQDIGTRCRTAKQVYTDLKKEHEVSQVKIGDYIDERQKYRGHPPKSHQPTLTDLPPATAPASAYTVTAGQAPADTVTALPQPAIAAPASADGKKWFPDDLYKKFPIADWNKMVPEGKNGKFKEVISEKLLGCLASGTAKKGDSFRPIHLVGDLEPFTKPNPNDPTFTRNYGDIKGVAGEGATKISDAEIEFWKYWNGGGAEAFAMKQGFKPDGTTEGNADADSKPGGPGTGSGDAGPGGEAGAGDQPGDAGTAKPGKRRKPNAANPGARGKLRGGTNQKKPRVPKPKRKDGPTAEELEAREEAEAAEGA